MALTEQQKQAIIENGQNIIVSAGAGSGKTRVLAERVFDRISNKDYKWNIDEMLILTFTNAAAANMKFRIREKILLNEDNKLTKDEQQKQLNKIDNSFIMTFDAYAQFIVKKYHQTLGIDKNIKIVDTNVIKQKTNEYLEEIFENKYKEKNKEFINLINNYCVKDDYNIRESIIDLNNKLNNIYNRKKYIEEYSNNYYSKNKIIETFNEYEEYLIKEIKKINDLLNDLSNYVENYKDYFVGIDNLLDSKTYEEIRSSINIDHSKQMRGQGEEAKQIKAEIVEELNKLESLCQFSKEELINQILSTESNCVCLIGLAEELNNKLLEYKYNNNIFEFSDIFDMAIKLVDLNNEIKDEIKDSFKEILIDEYQDTNDLQDEFIKRIENNNIYMVGDIKQSIYRFRNANPELFKEKYESYKNNNNGKALMLSSNFRSRKEVIDGIDCIFSRIMDAKIGGANYYEEHRMKADNSDYTNAKVINNQSFNMEVLNYPYDSETKLLYPFTDLKQSEVEAFIIAKDIEDKVKSGYLITCREKKTDEKGHEIEVVSTRPVEYKDFTILVDRGTNFDTFKQILTSRNIPSDIYSDEKIDESDLITAVRAAFKLISCIKNKEFDYDFKFAYMSLARSFLVEMLDSTLHETVVSNSYEQTELYKKINNICENIESKDISTILDQFIDVFDVYNKLSKIGDIHENFVRIDYLYQIAKSLNDLGYDYLDFNDYLINVFDLGDEDTIKYKIQKDNQNAVVITNIHQSKGLEYSICYYPLLTVAFNRQDIKDNFVFSKKYGLVIPAMINEKGLKQTIEKELFKQDYLIDDLSERIRLFYVALTRAKEKAILVCPLENKTIEGKVINDYSRLTINKYKDLLDMIYDDLADYIKEVDFDNYKDVFNSEYMLSTRDIFNDIPDTNKKISVKKLNHIEPELLNETSFSKKSGLIDASTIAKMELGTKAHYYLEVIDFKNPNYDLIDEEFKPLIQSFMDCEIMKDCEKAKIYKEYEFIYEENNEKKHGFIDLLMEYDDHFDIIDYKTKNINDEHYNEQLNGYRKYIKSISEKEVNCYLYSIIDKTYRTVK